MTPEQIAEVCHEANRVLTKHIGDVPVQPPWADAPEEMRKSCIDGVRWRLLNPALPAGDQHEEWRRAKIADGWRYDQVKDAALKTHPALVPFEALPDAVQAKDRIFTAIVLAF